MNEQFIKNIRVIKTAIAERKLVVFAGAGISFDSGVPTWGELINELRKEIDIPCDETDYLRIAQMYYNERQQKEFIDKIRNELRHKKVRYNDIHEAIFELNPEHIITTNFDDLLEQVIKSKAYPFSVIKKDEEFPYANNTKLLVKIHGDLDEANLVIKEDDYLEFSRTHPLIEGFIKGVFANKLVLFIGYSFSDLDLKIILQTVRNILGKNFQNAYMLSVENDFHQAKRQYLKNNGINVINYTDAGSLYEANYIERYLFNGHNSLNHTLTNPNSTLSDKGSKLLNLIKFITKYFDFPESIITDNPLNQIYKSLNRFKEVRSLPPNFLGNLFPFSNRKKYIHNYYNYTLGSSNKTITDLFFEDINYFELTLKESFYNKFSISSVHKQDYDKKLQSIVMKLHYSLITSFGRNKEELNLFDYPNKMDEIIEFILQEKTCNCLNCLFDSFRIKAFLENIEDETINETSEIENDLLLAYSNYKAGNIKVSYLQFEEIANKAWQLGKYISYYIAQQNIKSLRNLLDWVGSDSKNRLNIIEKIDDIDLDKLIFQIPNLDDEQYKLLKIIRDDEILIDAENKINEYYEKVLEVYNHYKEGGFSTGPYYPNLIVQQLNKIFFFYNYNCIVKDVYIEFKRIMNKAIKALLICYSIEDEYPEKLRSFNSWTLKIILLYGDDSMIYKTIVEQYKVKELYIDDESLPEVILYLNNLFESFINQSSVFKHTVSLNDNISNQTKNFLFQDTIRNIVQNALLIFSKIKILEVYAQKIIKNFFDFIRTENVMFRGSSKYLNQFLFTIKDFFSVENYIELLKITVENKAYYCEKHFYEIIGYGIKKMYPDFLIEDEDLIKLIIEESINIKKHNQESGFMYLWQVCTEINKKQIEDALKHTLKRHFDTYNYLEMCFCDIINPSEFYPNYVKELEKYIPKDIVWENEKIKYESFIFFNFINMLYIQNRINDNIPFNKFDGYPLFWKFYFKPFEFNYENFQAKWLLYIDRKHVHDTLNQIPQICTSLKSFLHSEYNAPLSEIYVRYYLGVV